MLLKRLGFQILIVALLVGISWWPRQLPPGATITILANIGFFVALGAADELLLGPALLRWPLARSAALVLETLALGWFFSPGRLKPASKILFFAHLLPFFAAVFGGALLVVAARWWRRTHGQSASIDGTARSGGRSDAQSSAGAQRL